MLHDPIFWYTVAFAIFLVLALRHGKKPLFGWLDAKIEAIRDELARARALRVEAEATLAEFKKKQEEAMAEAEEIVRRAKEEAVRLKIEAENELKAMLARHEHQALERLKMAEIDAVNEVRAAIVEQAMAQARQALAAQGGDASLIDKAIAELPKLAARAA